MKNIFTLSHVVLYAKGYYNKSGDIYTDLKQILQYDDYSPFTNNDVFGIISHRFQESGIYRITDLTEVLNGISPYNCWKYGYVVEESKQWFDKDAIVQKYDIQTAFIYYVLSSLSTLSNENWIKKVPKYSKITPRPKNIELKTIIKNFKK